MLNRLAANINCITHCFTIWPMFQTNHLYMEHETQFHVRCWLNACFVFFFFMGIRFSMEPIGKTLYIALTHCFSVSVLPLYLTYTHFGLFTGCTLPSPLLSISINGCKSVADIFLLLQSNFELFCMYLHIVVYLHFVFDIFFFHFSFFDSLLQSSVIRRPIWFHNAICSRFLECFVGLFLKCRRCRRQNSRYAFCIW